MKRLLRKMLKTWRHLVLVTCVYAYKGLNNNNAYLLEGIILMLTKVAWLQQRCSVSIVPVRRLPRSHKPCSRGDDGIVRVANQKNNSS